MVGKRKNGKTETKRVKVAFDKAFSFASDKAKSVAEAGTESLESARNVVRARPLTTTVLTLGAGALVGCLAALIPNSLFRDS